MVPRIRSDRPLVVPQKDYLPPRDIFLHLVPLQDNGSNLRFGHNGVPRPADASPDSIPFSTSHPRLDHDLAADNEADDAVPLSRPLPLRSGSFPALDPRAFRCVQSLLLYLISSG
jgi:hypothetical protein